jgi:hypothetical protein
VSGETKPTNFRIDYRNEIIRARAGALYQILETPEVKDPDTGAITTPAVWSGNTSVQGRDVNIVPSGSGDDHYGTTFRFRMAPAEGRGARKPPSAWQIITVESKTPLTIGEILSAANNINNSGQLVSNNKIEYLIDADRNRWAARPATPSSSTVETFTTRARIRPTARYTARTDTTIGNVVSREIELEFTRENTAAAGRPARWVLRSAEVVDPRPLSNEVLFLADTTEANEARGNITDKQFANKVMLAVFDIITEDSDDGNKAMTEFNKLGIEAIITGPGRNTIKVGSTTPTVTRVDNKVEVSVDSSDIADRFTPGNISVEIVISETTVANREAKRKFDEDYAFYSSSVTRTLTTSPPVQVGIVNNTPRWNTDTSQMRVTAAEGQISGTTRLTFELTAEGTPYWGFADLEFAVLTSGTSAPNTTTNNPDTATNAVIYKFEAETAKNSAVITTTSNTMTIEVPATAGNNRVWVRVKENKPSHFNDNPPGAWVSMGVNLTADGNQRNIKATSSATVGTPNPAGGAKLNSITIAGTRGTAFSANTHPTPTSYEIVITLTNDKFIGLNATNELNSTADTIVTDGDNIDGSWFTNMPVGLTATVVSITGTALAPDSILTVRITGTPTTASTAPLQIRIPGANLENIRTGRNLLVTANTNVKFYIEGSVATITTGLQVPNNSGNYVIGNTSVGAAFISPAPASQTITITLRNEEFKASILTGDTEKDKWIKNLPDGLTAAAPVRDTATRATITITGTPTAPSNANINIVIPHEVLDRSDTNLTATTATATNPTATARFSILEVRAELESTGRNVSGRTDIETFPQALNPRIAIILTNDTFRGLSAGQLIPGDWFTTPPPNNINARIRDVSTDTKRIEIEFEAVADLVAGTTSMAMRIPYSNLTNLNNIIQSGGTTQYLTINLKGSQFVITAPTPPPTSPPS